VERKTRPQAVVLAGVDSWSGTSDSLEHWLCRVLDHTGIEVRAASAKHLGDDEEHANLAAMVASKFDEKGNTPSAACRVERPCCDEPRLPGAQNPTRFGIKHRASGASGRLGEI